MNILGLLLNLVGVVLLFCVGMPFQIPADTKIGRWSTSSLSFRLKSPDDFYTILGMIGLSAHPRNAAPDPGDAEPAQITFALGRARLFDDVVGSQEE